MSTYCAWQKQGEIRAQTATCSTASQLVTVQQCSFNLARAVIKHYQTRRHGERDLYTGISPMSQQASLAPEDLPGLPASGDGEDSYHPNLSTHAERTTNPVQGSRTLSKLSDAQKAS
jgi:hypothetical protein